MLKYGNNVLIWKIQKYAKRYLKQNNPPNVYTGRI